MACKISTRSNTLVTVANTAGRLLDLPLLDRASTGPQLWAIRPHKVDALA